ncbi:MAG: clostripain-related cysteine peptidase [Bacilli bacterium]|nr:clostripain-related cysteine peptidase [Bacilli bacterium]MDY6362829.1 clostripain-related cysteine peptidase [Bacilli bacterium]
MKKLIALTLSALLLAGCTAGTPRRRQQPSSEIPSSSSTSEQEVISEVTAVSFNREEINFNLNQENPYTVETLIATVSGIGNYDRTVSWITSNQSIVTVENGVVSAVGIGEAMISAVSTSNEEAYATCRISVINDVPVIEGVVVNPAEPVIDLKTESTLQLTATVLGKSSPSQLVNWTYTGYGCFTVDTNGLVTATKVGNGIVTASSAKDSSKIYTVTVRVVNTTPTVESVKIMDGSEEVSGSYALDLYEPLNQKSVQFTAKVVVTYGAPETVTWTSSDPNKVEVNESTGLVSAKALTISPVIITATSTYDSTKSASVKITVNDSTPRVSSISISVADKVKEGKTITAEATVLGTGLTPAQKAVTWSSSNPTIAEINSSTGEISAKQVGGPVTITATSVFKNPDGTYKSATAQISVIEPSSQDAYTILLYVCGSNLESDNAYATTDLKEIVAAGALPEGVNVVVETGGSTSWSSTSKNITGDRNAIPKALTRWTLNSSAKLEKVSVNQQPSDSSMGESSTFESFLEWGLTNYPADKTGIILWNHGGGMNGCCNDDNYYSDALTPAELYRALQKVLGTGSSKTKLEWIGYDCCTMQVADIASINADYFHYQVASQELEDGNGWSYTNWVKKLYQSVKAGTELATSDLLNTICEDFVSAYGDDYSNNQVLSAIKLDNMSTFVNAFNEFTADYDNQESFNNVKSKSLNTLRFSEWQGACFGDVDMRGLLLNLGATETSTVVSAFDNLIASNEYCNSCSDYQSKKPSGLNAFVAFAPSGYSMQISKSNYNHTDYVYTSKFTTWCDMNRNYGTFSWY